MIKNATSESTAPKRTSSANGFDLISNKNIDSPDPEEPAPFPDLDPTKVQENDDGNCMDPYKPFTPSQIANAQAADDELQNFLLNPDESPLYPKSTMSLMQPEESELPICMFRKRVYVPASLRKTVLKHYYMTSKKTSSPSDCDEEQAWTKVMCRDKIWPSMDSDTTDFISAVQKASSS